MKKTEIIERLSKGQRIIKQSEIKFKRNKIVRGSSYSYKIDGETITEKQFDDLYSILEKDFEKCTPSQTVWYLK